LRFEKHYPLILLVSVSASLLIARLTLTQLSQVIYLTLFYIALGEAFNVFTGLTLYVCFGYVAFVALGMYGFGTTFKYLITYSNATITYALLLSFVIAVFYTLILALAIGFIGLRLRGAYFAIATVGLSIALKNFIEGTGIWGGSSGLILPGSIIGHYGHDTYVFLSTELADYMLFIVYVISIVATLIIIRSRLGYGLLALKEDEDVANTLGVNTVKYKIIAFIISAALAGMIGAANMLKQMVIYPPQAFDITYTIEAIVIVMLGGLGTVSGPIIGGLIYGVLKYVFTVSFPGLQLLVLAPVLIVISIFFPYGLVGWIKRRFRGSILDRIFV